jgi:hypothetical protein
LNSLPCEAMSEIDPLGVPRQHQWHRFEVVM